jgi:hypothetical protein
VYKPVDTLQHRLFSASIKDIPPERR